MEGVIKQAAGDLGFFAAGITTAEPVNHVKYLKDAIDAGRIASMAWLSREPKGRCDPSTLLPGAKSVICCALQYGERGIDNRLSSRGLTAGSRDSAIESRNDSLLARFARGADYHIVVREKLEKLRSSILSKNPGMRSKICVDTSPVMEKALAARAGIGFIGKHTVLVNETFGSWFVLGLIVTDLKLKADKPAFDRCGTCTACIDACPTNAFLKPNRLDARKCISYLTIEHKGDVPADLKTMIKEGQYGCDLCQLACPFNAVYNDKIIL